MRLAGVRLPGAPVGWGATSSPAPVDLTPEASTEPRGRPWTSPLPTPAQDPLEGEDPVDEWYLDMADDYAWGTGLNLES